MSGFREIGENAFLGARRVVDAVSGRGPRPDIEVMPGFEGMVAGAAIALEKGAPHLVSDDPALSTSRMFDERTPEHRMLVRAVARAIDIHENGPQRLDEPGAVMTHIASDMWTQGRGSRMALSVSNADPAYSEGLTDTESNVVRYARESMAVRLDVASQASGEYEMMDTQSQREMRRDLLSGEMLPAGVAQSISASAAVVSRDVEHVSRNADLMSRLGDLQDFGMPVFHQPRPEHFQRAEALASGLVLPVGEVDKAIVAHAALSERQGFDDLGTGFRTAPHERGRIDRVDAYSRALADFADRGASADRIAVRIEADLVAVVDARRTMILDGGRDEMPEGTANVAHRQRYSELPVERQASLFAELERGDRVPALATVRLGHAVGEVERGELSLARQPLDRPVDIPQPSRAAEIAARSRGTGME